MTKELVVSLYNRNINWTCAINTDVKISIYRKGSLVSHPNEIILQNNVGRDVHTFFHHIVKNYNSLADYTFFSQDYPFDHIENYIDIINGNIDIWNLHCACKFEEYWGYHFNSIGTMWKMHKSELFNGNVLKCNKSGHPHHGGLDLEKYWNIFFVSPLPCEIEFMPGGHFSISKNQIYKRSIKEYKKIVAFLEDVEIAHG